MDLTTIKQLETTYYIDYYDMNDGWLGWGYVKEFHKDRIFSNFEDAYRVADALNNKLDFGNVSCGEYYDVKQVPESEKSKKDR